MKKPNPKASAVAMRPCLGIGCLGTKLFLSSGKKHRKCGKCLNMERKAHLSRRASDPIYSDERQ